jgi:reticulon-4-interacting protein 1, mitochondrial
MALLKNEIVPLNSDFMRAAALSEFGGPAVVRVTVDTAKPIQAKDQVLVRQVASSVNPIDCHRRGGYGQHVMKMRGALNFPVILGNDVAGHVVAVGAEVTGFAVGDAVMGVKGPSSEGSFAEFVAVDAATLIHKPDAISFTEAAALPYAFFTAWSALIGDGGLSADNGHTKHVFIQGGAGGVGSVAVQIAKALGARVTATASPGKVDLVSSLGADRVIDYTREDYAALLDDVDIAFCTASMDEEEKMLSILKRGGDTRFVTVIHPLLKLTDEKGLMLGFVAGKAMLAKQNRALRRSGRTVCWSIFKDPPEAVALFEAMVHGNRLHAIVDQTFALSDIVAAQERLESGKAQGKVIVEIG